MNRKHLYSICIIIMIISFTTFSQSGSKVNIAVNEFQAQGISTDEAAIITNRLRSELIKTDKFTVVERGQMESILKEQGFQRSGCASDECIVEVGQLLGVSTMIAGSIGKIGNMYTVNVRVIDVATGRILNTTDSDCKCKIEELLTKTTKEIAKGLTEKIIAPVNREEAVEKEEEQEPEPVQEVSSSEEVKKPVEEVRTEPDQPEEKPVRKEDKKVYKNGIILTGKNEFQDTDFYISLDILRLFNDFFGFSLGCGVGVIQSELEFYGGAIVNLKPIIIGLNMGYDTYAGLLVRVPVVITIKRFGILLDVTVEPATDDGVDAKIGIGAGIFF